MPNIQQPRIGSRVAILIVKIALAAAFLCLALAIISATRPSNPVLATVASLPKLIATKQARCSIGDACASIKDIYADGAAERRARGSLKILRNDGPLAEIEVESGRFWVPKRDIYRTTFVFREQEKDIYENASHRVRPGDTVLDCGANVGVFTRRCLRAGAGKVISIDPSPECVECLRRNFAREIAAGQVVVYPKGVWNAEDWLELTVSDEYSVADTVALQGPGLRKTGVRVPLTTIDKLAAELKLSRVDFIKMDIEGSERQALEGALRTVAAFHPKLAIVLEHHLEDCDLLPAVIRQQWPDAKVIYGPCSFVHSAQVNRVQPEVLFAAF